MTGLDDIQQQLDDHILKSQTMRGSPYVKAFEADMVSWEEKLISMQDILDQWLQVRIQSLNKVLFVPIKNRLRAIANDILNMSKRCMALNTN